MIATGTSPHWRALVDLIADDGIDQRFGDAPTAAALRPDGAPASDRSLQDPRHDPEAIHAGFAHVGGHRIALLISDYDFRAGTIGLAATERICRTFEQATATHVPVVAVYRSGGMRMQEGTPAFLELMAIAAAVSDFRASGGLFISYLAHPATGGGLAALATQAHLVWAEPGALISMTGPRVAELVGARPVDCAALSAEAMMAAGHIDDIVTPVDLRGKLKTLIELVSRDQPSDTHAETAAVGRSSDETRDVWESIERSRSSDRFGIDDLVKSSRSPTVELRGDRAGTDDSGLFAGFTRLGPYSVVLVGHRRVGPDHRGAAVGAGGYRKAQRAILAADQLGLPLVTVIDTRGVPVGVAAEQAGLASSIGDCLTALLQATVPTISLLLGEGSGGGTLALLPTDASIAMESAWLAPIAPEAASTILYRSTDRAQEVARMQRAGSGELFHDGLLDTIVAEPPTASIAEILESATSAVCHHLAEIIDAAPQARLARRRERMRFHSRHL